MKFKAIYSSLALAFAGLTFLGNSNGPSVNGNGDRSGASGAACYSCHGSGAEGTTTVMLLDTFGNQVTNYTPGYPHILRFYAAFPSPSPVPPTFGYGINARVTKSGNTVGTMTLLPGFPNARITQFGGLEHTAIANNGWDVRWVAPVAGTGAVTVYAATIAANQDGTDDNDILQVPAAVTIQEQTSIAVNEVMDLSGFMVFPTQAEERVNVRFVAAEAGQYTTEVVSLAGQVLSTRAFAATGGEQTEAVEVANLAAGTYFVRLRSERAVVGTKAFIKF